MGSCKPTRHAKETRLMVSNSGFVASCARLSIFFRTDASSFTNNASLLWTIWTINEPANYIIAACLPTLRPIFQLILPSSFFILSKGRSNSKRSTPRVKILQSPSSSMMLSPLDASPVRDRGFRVSDGSGRSGGGGGVGGARRHIFPWTGPHPQSQCEECWVDIEASQPRYDEGEGEGQRRHAVMRAPGREGGGEDEVVVETMVQVSRAENYF